MNNKVNNKLNIKYMGSNKSYTYDNIRFENGVTVCVDKQIAEKLLNIDGFVNIEGDDSNGEKSI